MGFADTLKKLDAHRLQQSVKATVQSNGRLTFTAEATKEMQLSDDKSLIIFEADDGNLGATISVKGDPEAFVLKKCGVYYYVAFKNYLQQAGIDYKAQRIIYDITELTEQMDGRTLYKFERRVLPKIPEQLPISEATASGEGDGDGSGDGRGIGDGAGEGDGSGVCDDEPPVVESESADELNEKYGHLFGNQRTTVPTRPTRPMPPPPTRPARPMPPPPQQPSCPFDNDDDPPMPPPEDDMPF